MHREDVDFQASDRIPFFSRIGRCFLAEPGNKSILGEPKEAAASSDARVGRFANPLWLLGISYWKPDALKRLLRMAVQKFC
jgi:hypothetical protein